jgi:hypothetical protein
MIGTAQSGNTHGTDVPSASDPHSVDAAYLLSDPDVRDVLDAARRWSTFAPRMHAGTAAQRADAGRGAV